MTVKELIEVLEKKDPSLPVVIRKHSDNLFVDDFIDISESEVKIIEAQVTKCPVIDKFLYNASIHAEINTKAVSLTGGPILNPLQDSQ